MKVGGLLCMLFGLGYIYDVTKAVDLETYSKLVHKENDRKYGPIRSYNCRESRLRNYKFCKGLYTHRYTLKRYSDMYLKHSINYWRYYSSSKDEIAPIDNDLGVILTRVQSPQQAHYVRKRSAEENLQPEKNISSKIILNRSKRDIPGNPCVRGPAKRTTIVIGLDAITKKTVEIFQNPNFNMFQTFYTKPCVTERFNFFTCETVYTEYMTAVFDEQSYGVGLRPVRIPTSCGMVLRH